MISTAHRNLGCFKDSIPRAIYELYFSDPMQSVEMCLKNCAENDYKYFGVQNGAECYCSMTNDYDKYGSSTECDVLCLGNQSETCGGIMANQVYEIGVDASVDPLPRK